MEIHSEKLEEPEKNNSWELNKSQLPYGITTGTAAAAAALTAFFAINKKEISTVTIYSPSKKFEIRVHSYKKIDSISGIGCIIKLPYKDPDVTTNIKICAHVTMKDDDVIIKGGKGVGTVTKPGLQVPPGSHAINPVPMNMIKSNLKRVLPEGKGAEVTIFVPEGEEVSKKTMNKRLGIEGGISILGTTGIARPMSSSAYKESLACQIDVALAQGFEELIFVPGNIGEGIAREILHVDDEQIVQMGNFVGFMLDRAHEKGVNKITILGHAGKIIKIAAGIFNTKNNIADGRREIIAAYCGLLGAKKGVIEDIFKSKTTEDMINILDGEKMTSDVFSRIGEAVKKRCRERVDMDFNVFIVKMDGKILNNSTRN